MTLDLAHGAADEHGVRLGPTAARILLLDWTRTHFPTLVPTALWAIEAAALATDCEPAWREWAGPGLSVALDSLARSRVPWPDPSLLAAARNAAASEPLAVDGALLRDLLEELAGLVRPRMTRPSAVAPTPGELPGCAEPEWDLLERTSVALGEHAIRSRAYGTVWVASMAAHPARRWGEIPALWARLADADTGEVHDARPMSWIDGLHVARGFRPAAARGIEVRVDVSADPGLPARDACSHRRQIAIQSWFRALLFARFAAVDPAWDGFAQAYAGTGAALAEGGPFVAELLTHPADLATVRRARCRLDHPIGR